MSGKTTKEMTDDELLTMLREKAAQLGCAPTMSSVTVDDRLPNAAVFCRRFGSWRIALEKAGIEHTRKTQPQMYSNRELLELLKGLSHKIGRIPTIDDVRRTEGIPCPETYRSRFGNWDKVYELAGLSNPQHPGGWRGLPYRIGKWCVRKSGKGG